MIKLTEQKKGLDKFYNNILKKEKILNLKIDIIKIYNFIEFFISKDINRLSYTKKILSIYLEKKN
jgi:hypothetical protein